MCKYCHCTNKIENGFIGEQVGGDSRRPLHIMKLNNPIDNYLFWLVEGEVYYYRDRNGLTRAGREFFRVMPIYYCPECGFSLT